MLSMGSRLLHLLIDRTVTLVPHVGTSHCSPFLLLFSVSCFSTFAFGVVAVIAAAAAAAVVLPKAVR